MAADPQVVGEEEVEHRVARAVPVAGHVVDAGLLGGTDGALLRAAGDSRPAHRLRGQRVRQALGLDAAQPARRDVACSSSWPGWSSCTSGTVLLPTTSSRSASVWTTEPAGSQFVAVPVTPPQAPRDSSTLELIAPRGSRTSAHTVAVLVGAPHWLSSPPIPASKALSLLDGGVFTVLSIVEGSSRSNTSFFFFFLFFVQRIALDLIEMSAESAWSAARRMLGSATRRANEPESQSVDLSSLRRRSRAPARAQGDGEGRAGAHRDRARPARARRPRQRVVHRVESRRQRGRGAAARRHGRAAAEPRRDGALLVVEDDGPGMSEEQQQRAFEPYFTTKPTGTGLGSVAGQAGRDSKSAAASSSRATAGQRHTLHGGPAARGSGRARARRAPSAAAACSTPSRSTQRILVVDDDLGLREMISTALGMRGADVVAVGSAEAALAQQGPFAVAIVDLLLPDMRGDALLARIARRRGSSPVGVLMTGTRAALEPGRGWAARRLLRKPFELEELFEGLASALAGGTRAQPLSALADPRRSPRFHSVEPRVVARKLALSRGYQVPTITCRFLFDRSAGFVKPNESHATKRGFCLGHWPTIAFAPRAHRVRTWRSAGPANERARGGRAMMRFEKRWAQPSARCVCAARAGLGSRRFRDEVDYARVLLRMRREATPLAALGPARGDLDRSARAAVAVGQARDRHDRRARAQSGARELLRELLAHRAVRGARADAAAEALRGDGAARHARRARALRLRPRAARGEGRERRAHAPCGAGRTRRAAQGLARPRRRNAASVELPRERHSEAP